MSAARNSARLPARYMAVLCDILEELGIERRPLLGAAGVRSIDAPDAFVTLRQVELLLAAAERATGRLDLGFELAGGWTDRSRLARLRVAYEPHARAPLAARRHLPAPSAAVLHAGDATQRGPGRPRLPAGGRAFARSVRVLEEAIVVSNHAGCAPRSASGYRTTMCRCRSSATPCRALRRARPARVRFGDGSPACASRLRCRARQAARHVESRAMRAAEERCRPCCGRRACAVAGPSVPDDAARIGGSAADPRPAGRVHEHFVPHAGAPSRGEGTSFRNLSLEVRTNARVACSRTRAVGHTGRLSARLHRRRELRAQFPCADRRTPGSCGVGSRPAISRYARHT